MAPELIECVFNTGFWPYDHRPLFSHRATKLQKLIVFAAPSIPTDELPSLTYLAMQKIFVSPSRSQIQALFERCPQLQEAKLDGTVVIRRDYQELLIDEARS